MHQPNQRVGEYLLDESLGQSPIGESWRAHHHMWPEQLATVNIPTDPAYLGNLRKGVGVPRLAHPNIVKPLGFDPNAQPPYLATEFIAGGSLRPLIAQKRLSVPQSVSILRQVLAALQFGHDKKIIHGDIKPENILLEPNAAATDFSGPGCVKVTDFGVGLAANATTIGNPAAAQASGSAVYIAPEQRDGAPPDIKTDIYGVGVVLFEILTGERPSGAELPSEINPNVPPWLDDVFRKSYARRERRFDSAQSFLAALRAEGSAATAASPAVPAPVAFAPPPTRAVPPPAPPPAPRRAPIQSPVAPVEPIEMAEIGFRDEEPDYSPKPVEEEEQIPLDLAPADPVESPEPEPEPEPEAEPVEEQPSGPGDTKIEPAEEAAPPQAPKPAAPRGPSLPPAPPMQRSPSKADRDSLYDEATKKQLRTGDDIRTVFKTFIEARELDEGEAANIRIRLVKWANSLAGNEADFDQQIILSGVSVRPLHVVRLLTRTTTGDMPPRVQTVDHIAGDLAQAQLKPEDYRLVNHFSTVAIYEKLVEAMPSTALRAATVKVVKESRRELADRLARQDLLIYRANVIGATYRFDDQKYRVFFVGNSLTPVAGNEPFTRARNEPTKRAAMLLDGETIQQGLKELRRGLDNPQFQAKSGTILSAVRGKLAAAYVEEARQQFKSFGWLESLDTSAKAGQLAPGQEDSLKHAALVRKRTMQLQLFPGLFVAFVFFGCSVIGALSASPMTPQNILLQMVSNSSFLAAGVGALIAGIWCWKKLGMRMARTDLTFYHAAVLPLAIAGILAFSPAKFMDPVRDSICGGLLILVIVADAMLFKYLRKHLIREFNDSQIVGDEVAALNRVESMVNEDWERLKPHYLALGPLYSFTSVAAAVPTAERLAETESAAKGVTPKSPGASRAPAARAAPRPAAAASGGGDGDRLTEQLKSRLSATSRAIAPPARMVASLVSEYSKAVTNQQLGMMKAHAIKIEQKGKDLSDKLGDFERLCRSPLTADGAEAPPGLRQLSASLAARMEEPDIKLLRSVADLSKSFRENETQALSELTAILPDLQSVAERLKSA